MQKKRGFLALALSLFLLAVICVPHASWAQTNLIPSGVDAPGTSNDCPPNNAIDAAYFNNKSADMQRTAKMLFNVNTLYPIVTSANTCVTKLAAIFSKLPVIMSSPNPLLAVFTLAAGQIISSVITSTCQAALSSILSAETALTNLTKICIPLPKFNGLDFPKINAPSCSGGITISPISFSANPSFVQTSIPNLYLKNQ